MNREKQVDNFGCLNNTIRLRSGPYFDIANPKPEQFTLPDIAGALSKICRFGGQCDYFYSVAEHVYHCTIQANWDKLDIEVQKACLLHDSTEAFIGDMVKPLKIMLSQYQEVEKRIEDVIAKKFNVDFVGTKEAVKKIDQEMLIAEKEYLFSKDGVKWSGQSETRVIRPNIQFWEPPKAEEQFMLLWSYLQ